MDNVKTDSYYIEKIRKDLEFIVDHMQNVDIGYNECVHAYRIRWCRGRTETNGRIPKGTGRGRKEEWETNVAENV